MCGIRVLMQQDLKRLVQTIAECILRSPDKYHQGYFRSLEDQANGLQSDVPEAVSSECNPLEGEQSVPFGLFYSSILCPVNILLPFHFSLSFSPLCSPYSLNTKKAAEPLNCHYSVSHRLSPVARTAASCSRDFNGEFEIGFFSLPMLYYVDRHWK
jgi:hypothetical protein